MKLISNKVRIASTGSCLPKRRVPNFELIEGLATTDGWIRDNLGIVERRIAELPGESLSRLAAGAARVAIERSGLSMSDIGGLIVATSTPEQKAPSTACLVQNILEVDNDCFAFDIQAVCSGFIYALATAASMITSGAADNIVVIGADVFSQITNWKDRSCVFFGDGAGAVIVKRDDSEQGLFSAVLHARGSGHRGFYVPPDSQTFLMNPKAVYEAGTEVLPTAIGEALALVGQSIQSIKYVIPHQPSRRVLDETARRLGIDTSVVLKNMDLFANTAGATVPLLLDQTVSRGLLSDGDTILMAAVGSGWTWGASVYKWRI